MIGKAIGVVVHPRRDSHELIACIIRWAERHSCEVRGLEEAFALEGVRGIRVYRKQGHVFGELRRASDRAGAVLATGETRDDAADAAEEAVERIRFVTRAVEAVA